MLQAQTKKNPFFCICKQHASPSSRQICLSLYDQGEGQLDFEGKGQLFQNSSETFVINSQFKVEGKIQKG